LQKALAIYGSGVAGRVAEGEMPVKDKDALVEQLREAIEETTAFLGEHGVDVTAVTVAEGFERVKLLDDAVDAIVATEESKNRYHSLTTWVDRLYRAVQPDPATNQHRAIHSLLNVIATKIRSLLPEADIEPVMEAVEELLDKSIAAEGYVIRDERGGYEGRPVIDLSQIDFDALRAAFINGRKHIEVEKLKGQIDRKLARMVTLNKGRIDFVEKLQRLIDEYNSGSMNVEVFFDKLVELARELNDEEKRHIAEQLTEEELAIFDLLTKPDPTLSGKEEQEVKKVARNMLETLKREKLVLDWRKRQQSRAAVRVCIEETLDHLPTIYTPELYARKCNLVYQHVFDSYFGEGRSIYTMGA
jgi:type I restriction enzyme R subunit